MLACVYSSTAATAFNEKNCGQTSSFLFISAGTSTYTHTPKHYGIPVVNDDVRLQCKKRGCRDKICIYVY